MPKQMHKIEQFHGGLNSNSDPRDIFDTELSEAQDVMVDELGKIRTMGGTNVHPSIDANVAAINPGYGLFQFSSDRIGAEKSGVLTVDDLTPSVTAWQASQTHTNISQTSTDGNGVSIICDITTDGSGDPTFVIKLSGSHYVINEEITFTDPGSTTNTAVIIVASLGVSGGVDETGDDYMVMADTDGAADIDIYSKAFDVWGTSIIDLGSTTGMKPCFYYVDGALRVSDGSFAANDNQWYGYVYSKLYQTLAGAQEHLIDKWVSTDQQLKSFDDLSIDLVLDDCTSANPAATSMGSDDKSRIVIGWWKGEDGGWQGKYFIGISPVFIGGQEGPISIPDKDADDGAIDGTLTFRGEILNIQVFICQGQSASVSNNATHLLGDDRIIGLKLYSKGFPSDNWYLLKEIDLIAGGKFGWNDYIDSQSATGHMVGTHGFLGTDNAIFARFASTEFVMDDAGAFQAYEKGTAKCQVDIGTATLGTYTDKAGVSHDREGYLRVSGFYYTPVYGDIPVNLNSASVQNIDITGITLPAEANPSTFVFAILDENFNVLHKQQDQAVIAAASGTAPPSGGGSGGGGGGGGSDPYTGQDDTLI